MVPRKVRVRSEEVQFNLSEYGKSQLDYILMTLLCDYGRSHVSLAWNGASVDVTVRLRPETKETDVRTAITRAARAAS